MGQVNQKTGDVQPQPGAALGACVGPIGLRERLKDARAEVFRHAGAGVLDKDNRPVPQPLGANLHLTLGIGIFAGV